MSCLSGKEPGATAAHRAGPEECPMSHQSVYLELKIGDNDVEGESTVHSIDGQSVENAIECLTFEQTLAVGYEGRSSRPSGPPTFGPVRISKEIDRATPLLAQGLTSTSPVEATFHFFRQAGSGAGTKKFYEVKLENARVARVEAAVGEGNGREMPREQVDLVFSKITWTYTTEGGQTTAHSWQWSEQPGSQ